MPNESLSVAGAAVAAAADAVADPAADPAADAGGSTGVDMRRPGRPRDNDVDSRVLSSVIELIDEGRNITVNAVVKRSGVSRAAIYRRWQTLPELTAAALDVGRVVIRPPADLPLAAAFKYGFPKPSEPLIIGYSEARLRQRLLMALADPKLQRQYWLKHVSRRRIPLLELLQQAQREGEIREDADIEAALDLLSGVFYYQIIVRSESLTDPETLKRCNSAMDIILRGISTEQAQ